MNARLARIARGNPGATAGLPGGTAGLPSSVFSGVMLRTAGRASSGTLLKRAMLLCVCLAAVGCGQDIETDYGRRRGPGGEKSVNGTAVLGKMFEAAGHRVFSWYLLSPRLERADCIVWFPDDFKPPSEEVREWLEDWLFSAPDRTLIYVGRDFDSAGWYWDHVRPNAPADQKAAVFSRAASDKSDFNVARNEIPSDEDCGWFTVDGKSNPRKVTSLQGQRRWLEGIKPAGLEVSLNGSLTPSADAEELLASNGDMLVSREEWDESQLLVVANGSFLLNLPLVNHEHRKLAGKLVDELGPPKQTVVFLESRSGGPTIRDEDPTASMPSGLRIFNIWPTNWILLHLAMAGIIFCFWRFPIFGRPRELEPEGRADFGKHINALAELLARTRDRSHARTRLLHYRQTTKPNE